VVQRYNKIIIPPLPEGGGGILFYLCPSVRPSKIFFVAFFSVTVDGRNLMGPKTLPTIWGTYMKLVTKYQISPSIVAEKNVHICSMCIETN
jgi:hypothetical protein